MASISKPNTFSAGATIVASEHNDNFDTIYNDYNSNITNVNISASAAIADTKLAQITTASKVSMTALTEASEARGDLLYRDATDWSRLAVGTNNQILKSDGTDPTWGALAIAQFPSGTIIQSVSTLDTAVDTTTSTIPDDDTKPQSGTDGKLAFTRTITPTTSGNLLYIFGWGSGTNDSAGPFLVYLSEAGSADALAIGGAFHESVAGHIMTAFFSHVYTTSGTSELTFELNFGSNDAGTTTLNGTGGASKFGAITKSGLIILEVVA